MSDCLFCKIIKNEISSNKIYEDEEILAFLDINPVNKGHTLVVPKKHYRNLYETPDNTLCRIILATKKLALHIKEKLNADGINIMINNDQDAGQIIFHTHIHIVPRFKNDGFKHWKGEPYKEGEIEKTARKLKIKKLFN